MNHVFKYQCCNLVEFTTTKKNRTCLRCKKKIESEIVEYENVFNIPRFIKEEFPDWNLSPTAIAQFYEMIQTIVLLQADRCVVRATENGEKTIMARNFDWIVMDDFKEWISQRRE